MTLSFPRNGRSPVETLNLSIIKFFFHEYYEASESEITIFDVIKKQLEINNFYYKSYIYNTLLKTYLQYLWLSFRTYYYT